MAWRFPRRDCVALGLNEAHSHDEFEVYLVAHGRGTLLISGERKVLRPRSLVWVCPDQEHAFQGFSDDFMAWVLVITPDFAEQMVPRVPIFAERDPGRAVMRTLPSTCARLLGEIAQVLSTRFQPLDCYEMGLAWWLASAWSAYEHGDSRDVGSLHASVARAMGLLRENPAKNLKTLAHETGISPSQLSRLFKRQAGVSITDFRSRLRLDTFIERCTGDGDGAMFELAKDSGFGSYAQFSRVFRRHMGCSPEIYCRQHRHRKLAPVSLDKANLSPSAAL